ncbi:MAG: hypothetical protein JOZ81_33885 [Chloroflexi bacterium]|nr:hypothetical protein [Chloroflexota bacterium]
MFVHPDDQTALAEYRLAELRNEAAKARLIPASRWSDPALWAAVMGPIVGTSFLAYFAVEILRAVTQ